MSTEPTSTPSAIEQIEKLERQIADCQSQIKQLKHQALQELRAKLKDAQAFVEELQREIVKHSGGVQEKAPEAVKDSKKTRGSVTIEQIVEAIRNGAKNYRQVADKLGVGAATVTKKIKAEGEKAGIGSMGERSSFELFLKDR